MSAVDQDQWDMVRAFRAKAKASGLPWTFRSRAEFRKRFEEHLHKKIPEILARKTKRTKQTRTITQKASGTGNIQIAGDGNALHYKSTSTRPPKIVIAPSPGQLSPSEQRKVSGWIDDMAILMEKVEGKTTARAKAELWSRLKNQFGVQKYEQIESARLPEVEDWVRIVSKQLEQKAQRKAPDVFVAPRIQAIKACMREMGRTNADYYPEIANRLKMRRFSSLKDLTPKNLGRVYQLVLRDANRH